MYKYKYLKYKSKYHSLKQQIGGMKYYGNGIVPEFCYDTSEEYKNCNKRNLNIIEINEPDTVEFEKIYREILDTRNIPLHITSDDRYNDFIHNMKHNKNSIRQLLGFYNIKKKYDLPSNCTGTCNLDDGTFVEKNKLATVFKQEFVQKMKTDNFDATKGKGRLNLNKIMIDLKNENVTYIILEAAGAEPLIKLYQTYGFYLLTTSYMANIFEDEWYESKNALMYGYIDDVINATKIITPI
jgi:hypothetical protein